MPVFNTISIDARKFVPGAYIYSVSFDNASITKRLVIEAHSK